MAIYHSQYFEEARQQLVDSVPGTIRQFRFMRLGMTFAWTGHFCALIGAHRKCLNRH